MSVVLRPTNGEELTISVTRVWSIEIEIGQREDRLVGQMSRQVHLGHYIAPEDRRNCSGFSEGVRRLAYGHSCGQSRPKLMEVQARRISCKSRPARQHPPPKGKATDKDGFGLEVRQQLGEWFRASLEHFGAWPYARPGSNLHGDVVIKDQRVPQTYQLLGR